MAVYQFKCGKCKNMQYENIEIPTSMVQERERIVKLLVDKNLVVGHDIFSKEYLEKLFMGIVND